MVPSISGNHHSVDESTPATSPHSSFLNSSSLFILFFSFSDQRSLYIVYCKCNYIPYVVTTVRTYPSSNLQFCHYRFCYPASYCLNRGRRFCTSTLYDLARLTQLFLTCSEYPLTYVQWENGYLTPTQHILTTHSSSCKYILFESRPPIQALLALNLPTRTTNL